MTRLRVEPERYPVLGMFSLSRPIGKRHLGRNQVRSDRFVAARGFVARLGASTLSKSRNPSRSGVVVPTTTRSRRDDSISARVEISKTGRVFGAPPSIGGHSIQKI